MPTRDLQILTAGLLVGIAVAYFWYRSLQAEARADRERKRRRKLEARKGEAQYRKAGRMERRAPSSSSESEWSAEGLRIDDSNENETKKLQSLRAPIRKSSLVIPRVFVYWGSQTGTAENFAGVLATQLCDDLLLDAESVDLQDFNADEFMSQRLVVFVLATYGEGEPTDNAKKFAKWLGSQEREPNCLAGKMFAVCGLGNSQYPQFNAMAHLVDRHMRRLGASNFCAIGETDDDHDIEEEFDHWSKMFMAALKSIITKGKTASVVTAQQPSDAWKSRKRAPFDVITAPTLHELRLKVADGSKTGDSRMALCGADTLSKFYFNSCWAPLVVSYETRQKALPEKGLTTKHLELDLSQTTLPLKYNAGDTLDVLPANPPELVEWFGERIGLANSEGHGLPSIDDFADLVPRNGATAQDTGKRPFPTPTRIREILTFYCQLACIPSKSVLQDLRVFCDNLEEKDIIETLLSEANSALFKKYVRDSHMSLKDFIEAFMPSAQFDFGGFLQLVGRQRPRPYSICSSPLDDPSRVAIVVSQLAYELPRMEVSFRSLRDAGLMSPNSVVLSDSQNVAENVRRQFSGLCSTFLTHSVRTLAELRQADDKMSSSDVEESGELCISHIPEEERFRRCLRVSVRPSTLRLPLEDSAPVIMVATGTGIAPFRAFVREFVHRPRDAPVLFFGCTDSTNDWIYKDEMLHALESHEGRKSPLAKLFCAFSREQDQKVYVQHKMLEQKALLARLLFEENGYLYVCGYTRMGREVSHTVHLIAEYHIRRQQTPAEETEDTLSEASTTAARASASQNSTIISPQAREIVAKVRSTKHYVEELWE